MMKTHKHLGLSVTVLLLILPLLVAFSACVAKSPEGEPDSVAPQPSGTNRGTDESSTPEPADPARIAVDFAVRLGYDRSVLSAVDTEFVSDEAGEMWLVMLDDDIGPLADVGVNMDSGMVESFKLMFPPKEGDPQTVKPGDDMGSKIIDALGLDRDTWLPATWMTDGMQWEYRKYALAGPLKIAVGRMIISTEPRGGWLKAIHILDRDLESQPEILVGRDEAIEVAKSRLGLEEEPVNVELVQVGGTSEEGGSSKLYWEVAFEGTVVNVRTDVAEVI